MDTKQDRGIYGRFWDSYVDLWPKVADWSTGKKWPGDEWGTPDSWESDFRRLFTEGGVSSWQRAVEIGAGSGKYTCKVLSSAPAAIRVYDVSEKFLNVCRDRCKDSIRKNRLVLRLLDIDRPAQMLEELRACGWAEKVDGFYSMDAMVHVDLQYLMVYLLTAALTLKQGGTLILTLADGTTEAGFLKMMQELKPLFPAQAAAGGSSKFEWLSPEMVRSILPRLGFSIDYLGHDNSRDIYVRATLARPEAARAWQHFI